MEPIRHSERNHLSRLVCTCSLHTSNSQNVKSCSAYLHTTAKLIEIELGNRCMLSSINIWKRKFALVSYSPSKRKVCSDHEMLREHHDVHSIQREQELLTEFVTVERQ